MSDRTKNMRKNYELLNIIFSNLGDFCEIREYPEEKEVHIESYDLDTVVVINDKKKMITVADVYKKTSWRESAREDKLETPLTREAHTRANNKKEQARQVILGSLVQWGFPCESESYFHDSRSDREKAEDDIIYARLEEEREKAQAEREAQNETKQ